jgi:hypothetical protein
VSRLFVLFERTEGVDGWPGVDVKGYLVGVEEESFLVLKLVL